MYKLDKTNKPRPNIVFTREFFKLVYFRVVYNDIYNYFHFDGQNDFIMRAFWSKIRENKILEIYY